MSNEKAAEPEGSRVAKASDLRKRLRGLLARLLSVPVELPDRAQAFAYSLLERTACLHRLPDLVALPLDGLSVCHEVGLERRPAPRYRFPLGCFTGERVLQRLLRRAYPSHLILDLRKALPCRCELLLYGLELTGGFVQL